MADAMKLHLKRVHFGIAPVGSKLGFSIEPAKGFTVTAVLDCDSKVVASWEWVELKDGQSVEETLVPKGTYTLTFTVILTDTAAATAAIAVSVNTTAKTMKITGQKPDIGKAIAVVFIR